MAEHDHHFLEHEVHTEAHVFAFLHAGEISKTSDSLQQAGVGKSHPGICADHDHEATVSESFSLLTHEHTHDHNEYVVFDAHVHSHGGGCDHGGNAFHPEGGLPNDHAHGSSCDHDSLPLSIEQGFLEKNGLVVHAHDNTEHGHCKECGEHIEKGEIRCKNCKKEKLTIASLSHL